ncbi:ferritin-like domain-containing protein [Terriglobus roseus]|uniref:Ferritin-like domain-containing protein n=1 Tax=Terriglobus roseus TaxID=392734 RepID=A0A1H4L5B0_9BACT|nr:ferritin-like domain-containing protein [Terriglobus roseus]SEB65947.1 Ferritin-like domain-containing protein [Terriglobus roseus]
MDTTLSNIAKLGLSRRGFLAGAGAVTAATLVGCGDNGAVTSTVPTPPAAVAVTDVDILNFALNLEYLEAEFYLRAATGSGISAADGGGATVTVPATTKVAFSNAFYQQFAFELAQTELQHVRAIRATITSLGGTPVAAPALNFTDAFNAVAFQAGLNSFNPFSSDANFLIGALTFEEVGVTAYTGAAKLITSTAVLDAAAGIQAAEAYHAGAIRTIMAGSALSSKSTAGLDAYNSILQLLNKLDGTTHTTNLVTGGTASTNATVGAVYSPSSVVSADANAVGYARTTDQVLHIAYATLPGTFTASGGFFPSGLNGTIKQPTT